MQLNTSARSFAFAVAFALCGTVVAGCAGGSVRSSIPAAGSTASMPAGTARVTFRIDAPQNAASSNARSAKYVSPATTQMVINVQQNAVSVTGYPVTVALTPTSGGCASTLASTTCQLTVGLALGSYTATLMAEDANGTPLSSAQSIAFTVTSGPNTIPIALSGIAHTLQVVSGARAVHGSGASGLTLYGSAAQPVIVNALDADGNIIAGPGSPTYAASLVRGSGWSAAAPTSAAPNTIAITPPGTNGVGATFAVTATYPDTTCTQPGAVCTTTFTIANDIQTLFVSNYSALTVTMYSPPYTGAPTTISTSVAGNYGIALDPAGNLWVDNNLAVRCEEYAPPYTGAPTAFTCGNNPRAMLFDGNGNLFVANNSTNTVTVLARPYTGAPTTISTGVSGANFGLAIDTSGNLFEANLLSSTVTEYAPPYTGAPTATISTGVNQPYAVVLDAAGNLFVANRLGNNVTVYAPPYTAAPMTTISTGVTSPWALLLDPFGNLFVANSTSNTVTVYAPPYMGTPTTISNGVSQPIAIILDGAGNLFVANFGNNTVTEYAPPYTGAPIATISNGVNAPFSSQALLLTP